MDRKKLRSKNKRFRFGVQPARLVPILPIHNQAVYIVSDKSLDPSTQLLGM